MKIINTFEGIVQLFFFLGVYLFIWIFSALNSLSKNFKGIHDCWI